MLWADENGDKVIEDVFIQERLRAYRLTRAELDEEVMRDREKREEVSSRDQNQRPLRTGDLCLVFAPDRLLDDARSLRSKWIGPFPVVRQVSAVTYALLVNKQPRVFHIQRLLI